MKRPLALVALLYAGGVLLGDSLSTRLPLLFVFSLALAVAASVWAAARVYLLCPLVVLTGWTNLATRTAVLSPYDLRTLIGTNVEFVTLRGTLCETPAQRLYEHRDKESWHTLARLEVSAWPRGTNWQAASGRVAVTTPGVLGTNFFGGQIVEVAGVVRPPKGPAAEGLFDYRTCLRRQGIYHQFQVEGANDWHVVRTEASPAGPRSRTASATGRKRRWSAVCRLRMSRCACSGPWPSAGPPR